MPWRLATYNLDGSERVHSLPIGNFSFTHVLNAPGSFEGEVSMTQVDRADVEPGQTNYRIYDESDVLRAAGRIWTARVDATYDNRRVVLVGEGLWSVVRRRLISWQARYEPITESPANLNTQYGLSQEDMLWDLIDTSQGQPGGDIGLAQGTHTGSSVPRRRWYCAEDGLPISSVAEDDLASLDNGIDWAITPTLSDSSYGNLLTFNPSRGSPSGLVFSGQDFMDTLQYEIDAHEVVSRASALPQGDCDPVMADLTDATALADYGLLQDFEQVDTDDAADATEAAQEMLNARSRVIVTDVIEYLLDRGPAIGALDVGDTFTLQSPRPGWELDITARVLSIQVVRQMPRTFVRVEWTQDDTAGS